MALSPFFWGPSLNATWFSRSGAVWRKHRATLYFRSPQGSHCLVNKKYHEATDGNGPRTIKRNPKFLNYEVLGAQYLFKVFLVFQRQKLVACGTQLCLVHSPDVVLNTKIIPTVIIRILAEFFLMMV